MRTTHVLRVLALCALAWVAAFNAQQDNKGCVVVLALAAIAILLSFISDEHWKEFWEAQGE